MKTQILHGNDLPESSWAGGKSKEYYVYPPGTSYIKRDFLFRVSMATSETDEETAYTYLPGITRHLVMLDGSAHVKHLDQYDIIMPPYDVVDVFDGGWKTFGQGKVIDFNLMTNKDAQGKMSVISKNETFSVDALKNNLWLGIFCAEGDAIIELNKKDIFEIKKDCLFILDLCKGENAMCKINLSKGHLIKLEVFF